MTYTLIDGEARAAAYPDSFGVPPAVKLREGDVVKIGVEFDRDGPDVGIDSIATAQMRMKFGPDYVRCSGERFWVIVREVRGTSYVGEVNNVLAYSRRHGLAFGDRVEFEARHVLDTA